MYIQVGQPYLALLASKSVQRMLILAYQVDEEDYAGEGEYDAQEQLRRRRRHKPAQFVLCRLDEVEKSKIPLLFQHF